MGAEILQSPAHKPLTRKRTAPSALAHSDTQLCRAASARFAVQTQSQWKASLPDWRSGLLCNHGWVFLSLVAAPAGMWSSSTRGRAEHSWAARPLEKPRVPRLMAAPSLGVLGRETQTLVLSHKSLSCLLSSCISWWRLSFLCSGFFLLQSPGLFKACGPTAGCMEGVEGNVLELRSGLCCGWGGSMRRGPKSCPVPQKFCSNSPGGWEIQLPTGQIPLGWSAQRAGHCSLLLASSSWYWWKLTLSPASHVVSNSAAVWAGEAPQAGALRVAGRLGKPLRLCQPSSAASPQHSCQSSFPHLGCFAIYSPGNVSASQRVAKLFLPLVVNLHAGRQGVAENRTGSRGCA